MGAKGFLPNLWAGTAAACLVRLLSQANPLSGFQWSQAQQLAHSLQCRHRNAAKGVSEELRSGRANPADNISKLLLGAMRLGDRTSGMSAGGSIAGCVAVNATQASQQQQQEQRQRQAFALVFQEWLASMLQRFYGKSTPETDAVSEGSTAVHSTRDTAC